VELASFGSWKDVLAYARSSDAVVDGLYYQAPLDYRPTRLSPCGPDVGSWGDRVRCGPYSYLVRGRTIRIWPPGSNLRRDDPNRADPFTADVHHLPRFRRPVTQSRFTSSSENPLLSEGAGSLLLAGVGLVVVGVIGYGIYKLMQTPAAAQAASQAGQTQALPANLPPMPVNVVSPSENPYTTDSGS
jgi:preprotein translocase subunit Sss1